MNYIICVLLRIFFLEKKLLERFIFLYLVWNLSLTWLEILIKACVLDLNLFMFFFLSSSKLVNRLCYVYIYSFLNLGIVVHSIVIVGTLIFFCPLIFTKSEVCDYRSGAQRGYFGFLLMDLCEFSGFEFILGSFLSFISLVEKGWIPLH